MIDLNTAELRSAQRISELEQSPTAVLFADVVDSVRLIDANEETTIRRWLAFADKFASDLDARRGGRLVKRMGDGLLCEFTDVTSAIRSAFDIQTRIEALNDGVPEAERIEIRIGIDTGTVLRGADQDLYGRHVNIAARLATIARPGQALATADVRDAMPDALEAEFEDLGDCFLKNVVEPVHAFVVYPRGSSPRIVPILTAQDLLPTIAVIPFAAKHPPTEAVALGELLAEDLIGALSRSSDMNVISRLSTTAFRDSTRSLDEIATALHADFVLSGGYSQTGGRYTLDVELAEVRSRIVVWGHQLTSQTDDMLHGNTAMARLASQIHHAILKTEMNRALSNPMPTLEGYSLLMGSVALMHRLSVRDFTLAGELLGTLIDRTPNAPGPLAWMARWHVLRVQQGWSQDPGRDAREALECTGRALDLDPGNVPALIAEGFARNNLMRDLHEAEELYDSALELSPNDATGRLLRGTLYAFRGEGAKAVRETERAMHLAPLDPNRFFFNALAAGASIAAGDYPRALELAKSSLLLNRSHTSTLRIKAVAEWRLGLQGKAHKTAERLLTLQPGFTVGGWQKSAPSAAFPVGEEFARTLREIGVPG